MLSRRQSIIVTGKCADERRQQDARPNRIHEAESNFLDKAARLFDRRDALAIETPLPAAKLLEFGFSHNESCELRVASCELRAGTKARSSCLAAQILLNAF
jgi:hypothetical protein